MGSHTLAGRARTLEVLGPCTHSWQRAVRLTQHSQAHRKMGLPKDSAMKAPFSAAQHGGGQAQAEGVSARFAGQPVVPSSWGMGGLVAVRPGSGAQLSPASYTPAPGCFSSRPPSAALLILSWRHAFSMHTCEWQETASIGANDAGQCSMRRAVQPMQAARAGAADESGQTQGPATNSPL